MHMYVYSSIFFPAFLASCWTPQEDSAWNRSMEPVLAGLLDITTINNLLAFNILKLFLEAQDYSQQ